MVPTSVEEFSCIGSRIVESGALDSAGSREDLRLALQEVIRTIQAAHHVQPSISACERLVGSLFIRAIEQTVTTGTLLQVQDESDSRL